MSKELIHMIIQHLIIIGEIIHFIYVHTILSFRVRESQKISLRIKII